MSVRAMTWAFGQRVGSPMAQLVLLALADHHKDETGADPFPAIRTIAAETEMNERSVRRHLETLETASLIACLAQGRSKVYRLNLPPSQDRESDPAQLPPDTLSSKPASVSVKVDSLSVTPDRESTELRETASNPERARGRGRKPAGRATRLPNDWQPHQAEFDFALKEGLEDGLDCGRTQPRARNRDFR